MMPYWIVGGVRLCVQQRVESGELNLQGLLIAMGVTASRQGEVVFYEETQKGGASYHFDCTNFSLDLVDRAHIGSLHTEMQRQCTRGWLVQRAVANRCFGLSSFIESYLFHYYLLLKRFHSGATGGQTVISHASIP